MEVQFHTFIISTVHDIDIGLKRWLLGLCEKSGANNERLLSGAFIVFPGELCVAPERSDTT